jgi:hypothetical protein
MAGEWWIKFPSNIHHFDVKSENSVRLNLNSLQFWESLMMMMMMMTTTTTTWRSGDLGNAFEII